jgi:hypothetical protein
MLSLPRTLEGSPPKIDFPATLAETEILVRIMRQGNFRSVRALEPWSTIEKMLDLCRQFDFAVIRQCISSQLAPYATMEPLKVFAIASQYDNIALARLALSKYRQPAGGAKSAFPLSELKQCTKTYLIALVRTVYTCQRDAENSIPYAHWRDAVLSFEPEVEVSLMRLASFTDLTF